MSRTVASRPGRVGRPWREVSARVYNEEQVCWLCGEYVDQRLHSRHRMARGADHLHTLEHDGPPLDRQNLRLSHCACNTARSNRLRGVAKEDCACSQGLPCARLNPNQPRGYVELDPNSI
jgi:hypothetical protein